MFLHLGGNLSLAVEDIISIHDYRIMVSRENRDCWRLLQSQGRIVYTVSQPKSVVITKDNIYLSAISVLTLRRRAGMIFDTDFDTDSEEIDENENDAR